MRFKAPLVLALLLAGSAVGTYVFWRGVSFGRRLDDAELSAFLEQGAPMRKAQHGITELTERWREGRPGMDRWTERLVVLSRRDEAPVRRAAAWAMQFAAKDPAVAARLREMTAGDPDATAARNAACALSLGTDPSAALPVLRSMLEPYVVPAPAAGTVESLVDPGRRPKEDERIGRLRGPGDARIDAVTAVPGRVTEVRAKVGDAVAAGAPLVVLAPDPSHVLAAATGLAYAGTAADVEPLRAMLQPGAEMPPEVAAQVRAAIAAIERRAAR
jgi:biotin carboxyl carrier protein